MYKDFVEFVQNWYQTREFIPLHAPQFRGQEKSYVNDAIDSTFVSSVSEYVDRFEQRLCEITGSAHAISVTNGTCAIHLALHSLQLDEQHEVITQSLTFVATCNGIAYTGAQPIFVDVDDDTMGLSPKSLLEFLEKHVKMVNGFPVNTGSGKQIGACVPMHTFGHPARIKEIVEICERWHIPVVEDAAESLGSQYQGQHCGTFSKLATLSFNGNKIITTGGGGAILTDDEALAKRLKFLSTTAKNPHPWEYRHDELGFNYRMPGLNAALGVAQLEYLDSFVKDKRLLAKAYGEFTESKAYRLVSEPVDSYSNYWLNTLVFDSREAQQAFLAYTNEQGVMTRPAWDPMHHHHRFKTGVIQPLPISDSLYHHAVNVPSSPRKLSL